MTVRALSTRRQIAKDAAGVTRSAREVRASLLSVVKLINRTSREAETVTDDGIETMGWVRSSERDRLEDFYKAMTWLQQADNQLAQLRGHLTRAIERAEKRLG